MEADTVSQTGFIAAVDTKSILFSDHGLPHVCTKQAAEEAGTAAAEAATAGPGTEEVEEQVVEVVDTAMVAEVGTAEEAVAARATVVAAMDRNHKVRTGSNSNHLQQSAITSLTCLT